MNAKYWIAKLNLKKHPEGGYYSETYRADETVAKEALPERFTGNRSFGTAIYFLLEGNDFSSFHQLKADEVWHFYTGSGLTLSIINQKGEMELKKLGADFEKGEQFQLTVKANQWFAAKVNDPSGFSLVGCTMSPGFDFDDFQLAKRTELMAEHPEHSALIEEFTRQ